MFILRIAKGILNLNSEEDPLTIWDVILALCIIIGGFCVYWFVMLVWFPDKAYAEEGYAKSNQSILSFSSAKKKMRRIHDELGLQKTFYCGCYYNSQNGVDLNSCGYVPKHKYTSNGKLNLRALRIEWEHKVPASRFGKTWPEWFKGHPKCITKKGRKYKGRACLTKISKEYRYMQADLWNLTPAIGEVNGLRLNYPPVIIPGEEREFGACGIEISRKRMEPPNQTRGDIARAYLYMQLAYPSVLKFTGSQQIMFDKWDVADPVTEDECRIARKIRKVQGNSNPFILNHCTK